MKQIIIFCSFFFFVLSSSCSKSTTPLNNCDNSSYSQEFQDEITAISDATTVYSNNPTTENCNKFKAAYLKYIEALESWEECAIYTNVQAEWKQSLDAAKKSVEDIMC